MVNKGLKLTKTYDRCASKKPQLAVVLIHGIASDSTTFDGLLKHFENTPELKNVRFVTFDLLGSGKSLKSDELNYDYEEQIGALYNSISDLNLDVPLVLIGHSLGTFIVTRYASLHKDSVKKLVLISPPIYSKVDFDNPAFEAGIKLFKDAVSLKNRSILSDKSFINSMDNIVLDRKNYDVLAKITIPTILIYGDKDQFIGLHNFKQILKDNSKHLKAIKTDGHHGVSRSKFRNITEVIAEELNA